jgi:hypothetical protein
METPPPYSSDSAPDDFFSQSSLPGILDVQNLGSELLESESLQKTKYSGKIVEKNKERVEAILAARAMGFPLRSICNGFSVSAHTISELELRHRSKLATLKERLARKFGAFVELGIDRAIEEVDQMDIDKLLVNLGIATDKLQVLSGEPSMIIGNTSDGPRQFTVEWMKERLSRREINVTATGLGVEKVGVTREAGGLTLTNQTEELNTGADNTQTEGEK